MLETRRGWEPEKKTSLTDPSPAKYIKREASIHSFDVGWEMRVWENQSASAVSSIIS
jgi:hypothetical protein